MHLRPVRSVTIRGRRWALAKARPARLRGICESPQIAGKEMYIPVHGGTRDDLDTIIHELLHAGLWDVDEEAIHETATGIAGVLWRLGWRKQLEVKR